MLSNNYETPFSIKTFGKFMGSAGIMVSIGYMDPGNFSTNLAGSAFGYKLLFVILCSNIMAILFQSLCIKLGVVTRLDLAENCKKHLNFYVNILLYILAEIAIIATDLAEVIGSAIALNLLFGLPVVYGILITGLDVLLILAFFKGKCLILFERGMIIFVVIIAVCFGVLVFKTTTDWGGVLQGFLPNKIIVEDSDAFYISMGIIGATVMFHNLFLHSNLVKYRSSRKGKLGEIVEIEKDIKNESETESLEVVKNRHIPVILKYYNLDIFLSLCFALFINSAILISASSANIETQDISEAYSLFNKALGRFSATLFAIALLLSGNSSTITGTISGQIIMSGFLGESFPKIKPWLRRMITRGLAIIPAIIVATQAGETGLNKLLVLSQIILSLQLPFALWPLIYFTSSKEIMTINCVRYTKGSESIDEISNYTLNEEIEDEKDFSNGILMKIVLILLGILLTILNMYLLTQINKSWQ
jgi:manganese transport protein